MNNSKKSRMGMVGASLAAALALGTGIGSATLEPSEPIPATEVALTADEGEAVEQVMPDGTCDLVDAGGVPLYDSQFAERTGSTPCAEE